MFQLSRFIKHLRQCDNISKHFDVRHKYTATHRSFNSVLSIWNCGLITRLLCLICFIKRVLFIYVKPTKLSQLQNNKETKGVSHNHISLKITCIERLKHRGREPRDQCGCDGQTACQLFAKDVNLTCRCEGEAFGRCSWADSYKLLVFKTNQWDSEIPMVSKQEKLITIKKCLIRRNHKHSLHLQSCKEKPSDDGGSNKDASSSKKEKKHMVDNEEDERPREMLKQTTIKCTFKLDRREHHGDLLNAARG